MNKKAKPVCYSYLKRSVIGEREKHLVVLRQEPYEPETFVVLVVVAVYDDSRGFKMKTVKECTIDLPLAGQSMMISNIVIKVVLNLYFIVYLTFVNIQVYFLQFAIYLFLVTATAKKSALQKQKVIEQPAVSRPPLQ